MTSIQTTETTSPGSNVSSIATGLSRTLADTSTLYLKTHGYHWNVTGPHFAALHALFETQYNELWAAMDVIAERIRAVGRFAPASFEALSELTTIPSDAPGHIPDADDMIINLHQGNLQAAQTIRPVLREAAAAGDEVTADLLTARLNAHEKAAWMLGSLRA